MDLVDYVGALIRLGGGKIAGKTRLQKMAFLLEDKGIGFDIEFDYHNYGPFSAELAFATDDAESLGYVKTEEHSGYHSVPYTVFISTDHAPEFPNDDTTRKRQVAMEQMDRYSALVLELAATARYLRDQGHTKTFWDEVKKRKPLKASDERVDSAKKLLEELDL